MNRKTPLEGPLDADRRRRELPGTLRLVAGSVVAAGALLTLTAWPALAHDGPTAGAEWLMADWMLLSHLIFAGTALAVFLIASKLGYFHNVEEAKYSMFAFQDPDYHTPEWALEDDELDEFDGVLEDGRDDLDTLAGQVDAQDRRGGTVE